MDRKFSQLPEITAEQISGDDLVVVLTSNGDNAIAKVSTIAQGMSENEVTKESLGLGNVDNTADANKPVSLAQQNALDLKADKTELEGYATDADLSSMASQFNIALGSKASEESLNTGLAAVNERIDNLPTTGGVSQEEVDASIATAVAPLATTEALTTGLASKADASALEGLASEQFVNDRITAIVGSAPESLDTLNELAAALGDDANFAASVTQQLSQKANTSDLDNYVTTEMAGNLVTVDGLAIAIDPLATKVGVDEGLALKADKTEIQGLASTEYVDTAIAAVNQRIDELPAGGGDGVTQEQVDQSIATAIAPLATTEALTEGLAGKANVGDLEGLATNESVAQAVNGLASETYVNDAIAAIPPAQGGVTQEEVDQSISTAIAPLATSQSVTDGLALKLDASAAEGFATGQALTDGLALKADKTELEGLATQTYVDEAIAAIPPSGGGVTQEQVDQSISTAIAPLATSDALASGLAEKADATALNNYVTATQFTEDMALKANAADLGEYATNQALSEGLSLKADRTDLDVYATTTSVNALADTVATKADASALNGLASQSYVDTKVAELVGDAPETLNTLKEIADALADDASFAATMTQQLGQKANASDLDVFALKTEVTDDIAAAVAGTIHLSGQATDGQIPVFVGDEWQLADSLKKKLIWVDAASPALFRNGTYNFPFADIQSGVNLAATLSSGVGAVVMVVGGGTYAGFTIDSLLNVHVQGFGTNDSHQSKITGSVVLKGASCTRFKMKDFQIMSAAAGDKALEIQGTQGRHYFENVTLEYPSGGNASQPLFEVNGNFSNWIDLFNCSWNGQVHFTGTPAASAAFYSRGGNGGGMNIIQDVAFNTFLTNHTRMGYIKHVGGIMQLHNVVGWSGVGGIAIDSTADTGELRIGFSDFSKVSTAGFLKINKTGAAGYRLTHTNHDTTNDVINGVDTNPTAEVQTLDQVLKAVRPVISVAATDFGEGGAALNLHFDTTNGYHMNTVALNLQYKKTADASWTQLPAQAFTDGQLDYPFTILSVDDGVEYQIQGYLTDSNAPNVQVYSQVATFNHPAG